MSKLSQTCLLLLIALATARPAVAQVQGGLPDETALNRVGLTMDWWGQASVDPSRDRILHFTADEENVYVQSTSNMITVFQGETGRQLWTRLLGSPTQISFPATTNQRQMIVSIGLSMFSLNKDTGQMAWKLDITKHPSTSPEVDSKQIFVGTTDGAVLAYDLREVQNLFAENMLPQWNSRARMWNFQTSDEIVSPPIAVAERVTFAAEHGIVYSLSGRNKALRFQVELGGRVTAPLGYSKEVVLAADSNSRLTCLDQISGLTKWTYSSGAPIRLKPAVIGRQVFAVPHREGLTAIATETGIVQWQQRRATQLVAASETRVYASDAQENLLILDRDSGRITSILQLRALPLRVQNDRTDRLYLASPTGTVIGLRELGSDFPLFHLYPERRPLLPLFAPEPGAEESEQAPSAEQPEQPPAN